MYLVLLAEQKRFLDSLPLPESIREQLVQNNSRDFYKTLGVDTFRAYLCNYIACMIISALSFVATFVAMLILLKVLCFSLDLISKLPVLNQVNHLLGMAAGLAYALLLVWVGGVILTALGSTEAGSSLMKQVNDSAFLSFLYNNNPLMGKVADLGVNRFTRSLKLFRISRLFHYLVIKVPLPVFSLGIFAVLRSSFYILPHRFHFVNNFFHFFNFFFLLFIFVFF